MVTLNTEDQPVPVVRGETGGPVLGRGVAQRGGELVVGPVAVPWTVVVHLGAPGHVVERAHLGVVVGVQRPYLHAANLGSGTDSRHLVCCQRAAPQPRVPLNEGTAPRHASGTRFAQCR